MEPLKETRGNFTPPFLVCPLFCTFFSSLCCFQMIIVESVCAIRFYLVMQTERKML